MNILLVDGGTLFGVTMGATWFYTAINGCLALKNVKPGVSRLMLGFFGYRMFDPKYFTERGQRYQTQFGVGLIAFIVAPILIGLLSILPVS